MYLEKSVFHPKAVMPETPVDTLYSNQKTCMYRIHLVVRWLGFHPCFCYCSLKGCTVRGSGAVTIYDAGAALQHPTSQHRRTPKTPPTMLAHRPYQGVVEEHHEYQLYCWEWPARFGYMFGIARVHSFPVVHHLPPWILYDCWMRRM